MTFHTALPQVQSATHQTYPAPCFPRQHMLLPWTKRSRLPRGNSPEEYPMMVSSSQAVTHSSNKLPSQEATSDWNAPQRLQHNAAL